MFKQVSVVFSVHLPACFSNAATEIPKIVTLINMLILATIVNAHPKRASKEHYIQLSMVLSEQSGYTNVKQNFIKRQYNVVF